MCETHLWTQHPFPCPSQHCCAAEYLLSACSLLRVLAALAKDPGLVAGTACMAAFCLLASVRLRLHLQSSEGPLPVHPVMPKSDQIVCLLVSWLLVVLRTKPNLFFIRLSSSPPLPTVFHFHFPCSHPQWSLWSQVGCGSVMSPPTSGTGVGGGRKLFGVVFLSLLASSDSNAGVVWGKPFTTHYRAVRPTCA